MSAGDRATLAEVVALLAPTLGQEKSEEVVAEAARSLGILVDEFSASRAVALLDTLGKAPGMVGVAARFARTRFEGRPHDGEAAEEPPISSGGTRRESKPSSGRMESAPQRVERKQIVGLLAPTLGDEKSEEVVVGAITRRQLPKDTLDQQQALEVLEDLAAQHGLVGVTARFAKARLILLFRGPKGS
jgi:hypothetical protein